MNEKKIVVIMPTTQLLLVLLLANLASSAPIKMLYYSPASIGDNVVTSEIDLYTDPYMSLHSVYIPAIIERFGITHLLVNNRWDACEECHRSFLDLLINKNIKLYISLVGPYNGETAKGTTALLRVTVTELKLYGSRTFEGFYIPIPDKPMSDDEWVYYFNYANVIPTLFGDIMSGIKVAVEMPILRPTGKMIESYPLNSVNLTFWVLTIFANDASYVARTKKTLLDEKMLNVKILLLFVSSSYDNSARKANEDLQYSNMQAAISLATDPSKGFPSLTNVGTGFYEFSDEWWASFSSDAGFDIEGCPNSNPYAHTPCGERVKNEIINVEYLGLYSLLFQPFQSCMIPRKVVKLVQMQFRGNSTSNIFDPICATFLPVPLSFLPNQMPIYVILPMLLLPFILVMISSLSVYCYYSCNNTSAEAKKSEKDVPLGPMSGEAAAMAAKSLPKGGGDVTD